MSGSSALQTLCRKTRVLPAQVFQMVREFLIVHVGARCPLWINSVLQAKLYALPRSSPRLIKVSFHVSKTIEYGVYRQDEFEYGRTSRPRHRAMRGGVWSEHEADDSPVRVEAELVFTDRIGRWRLACRQGDYVLRNGDGIWLDITDILSEIRSRFDESEPCGSMEEPTTWRDWRRFVRLWLFGPPARRQPMLGLQRIPVAGELCRDCGKTSAPATMHPVHKLGEAFCSQQCAEASTVLTCSRCLEPLIAGQGLCRTCRRQ